MTRFYVEHEYYPAFAVFVFLMFLCVSGVNHAVNDDKPIRVIRL